MKITHEYLAVTGKSSDIAILKNNGSSYEPTQVIASSAAGI